MDVSGFSGKRRRFTWSKAARDLVRANLDAKGAAFTRLVTELEQLTGHPRDACLRFARSMGVKYKKPYRCWSPHETEKLLEYSESRSRNKIADVFRRSPKAIELMQRRLGISVAMQEDSFSKYELAQLIGIRRQTIQKWIDSGWLKVEVQGTARVPRVIIHGEDFINFCLAHPEVFHTRRLDLNKARLGFLFGFALTPHHARLFKVKEAKREEAAYQKQMAKGNDCEDEDDIDDIEDEIGEDEPATAA